MRVDFLTYLFLYRLGAFLCNCCSCWRWCCIHLYHCGGGVPALASPGPCGRQAQGYGASSGAWASSTFSIIIVYLTQLFRECNTGLCCSKVILVHFHPTSCLPWTCSRLWGRLCRIGCVSIPLKHIFRDLLPIFHYKPLVFRSRQPYR